MQRELKSQKFELGSSLPVFELPATDGSSKGSDYLKEGKASLVAFTCNHCPYVKGSEDMLIKIVNRYMADGLRVVAISSNDAVQYPEDSFVKMKEKSVSMKLPYPYLYDESQEVAKLFDAECTPEFYLFDQDQKLVYHGTINDSPRDPSKVTKDYLSNAITSVLEGQKPEPAFINPIGCSIKWRR